MSGAGSRPLTMGERAQLLLGCLPFLFFLVATIFVATVWSSITAQLTGQRTPLILILVMVVVLAVTGWIAVKRVRDLASGVALVVEDQITSMLRGRRGPSNSHCFGIFAGLGTLRMPVRDFNRIGTERAMGQVPELGGEAAGPVESWTYRVEYSPASKIAWSVEQR